MNKHLVVAITGGFATGKTTVAKIIEKEGYPVVYTDLLAKELMQNDEEIKKSIIEIFGTNAYKANERLNSEFIASIVFDDYKMLNKLNQIVHPKVIDLMENKLFEIVKAGNKLVFTESALIFESGIQDGFDYVVCVSCEKETQIQRAMLRHNLSYDDVLKRINSQIDIKKKEELSDFIIKNDGSIEELEKSTKLILNILKSCID